MWERRDGMKKVIKSKMRYEKEEVERENKIKRR